MKRLIAIFVLASALLQAGGCNNPAPGFQGPEGPEGPVGPPGGTDGASTAFGSFYQNTEGRLEPGESVPFSFTSTSVNITHPNDTEFVIGQSGYYLIYYGTLITLLEDDDQSVISVYVDGIEVFASRIANFQIEALTAISFIQPLMSGQVVTVVNNTNPITLGFGESTAAFINFIRVAPL